MKRAAGNTSSPAPKLAHGPPGAKPERVSPLPRSPADRRSPRVSAPSLPLTPRPHMSSPSSSAGTPPEHGALPRRPISPETLVPSSSHLGYK
jgi:hypothetical protein